MVQNSTAAPSAKIQSPLPGTVDLAVFIGRFRPFHNGHLFVVREALGAAEMVQILVGSSGQARSLRNPFTFDEVERMIRFSVTPAENDRLIITALPDAAYNDEAWVKSVQAKVAGAVRDFFPQRRDDPRGARISLIGHAKDHTSYYLKLFPQWRSIGVPSHHTLSATAIREAYFERPALGAVERFMSFWQDLGVSCPDGTVNFLRDFCDSVPYRALCQEQAFVRRYIDTVAVPVIPQAVRDLLTPEQLATVTARPKYPPIFTTADAVVIQSGHILLIRRGQFPGKGLWAMPGGYVEAHEKIEDAWVRELREETRLKVPEAILRGSVKARAVFDDPHRDPRGRIITHAFLVQLAPNERLPEVRAGDDAAKAEWVPLAALREEECYADHAQIIQNLVARL